MTPKIHYTPNGIPTHVTGGGTTKTRMTCRQKRRLLRTAQRVWARATITWQPDTYDTDTALASVDGVNRGYVRQMRGCGWYGRTDYAIDALWPDDGTEPAARALVESAIRRALGGA